MREAQRRKSAIGTAGLRGGKFPAPEMNRAYGTHFVGVRIVP